MFVELGKICILFWLYTWAWGIPTIREQESTHTSVFYEGHHWPFQPQKTDKRKDGQFFFFFFWLPEKSWLWWECPYLSVPFLYITCIREIYLKCCYGRLTFTHLILCAKNSKLIGPWNTRDESSWRGSSWERSCKQLFPEFLFVEGM